MAFNLEGKNKDQVSNSTSGNYIRPLAINKHNSHDPGFEIHEQFKTYILKTEVVFR